MNSHRSIAIAAFLGGIALTLAGQWIFGALDRGRADEPEIVAGAERAIGRAPERIAEVSVLDATTAPAKDSDRKPPGSEKKAADEGDDEAEAALRAAEKEAKKRESNLRRTEKLRKREKERSAARIALLAEDLGLTPAQIDALQRYFDKELERKFPSVSDGGGDGRVNVNGDAGGETVDSALDAILTPEQKAAYAQFQERERAHRVESRTMRRFADLPETLNLSDAQRDALYDMIAAEEAAKLESGADSHQASIVSAVSDVGELPVIAGGLTIEVNSTFTGSADSSQELVFASTGSGQSIGNQSKERNAELLERVRPILTERQLEIFRSHLNRRTGIISFRGLTTGD